jgi:U3 small nucleolar RNA-associated protein 12
MVKSYFRYELRATFGHANTNKCNVQFRKGDNNLCIGSGETVVFLNPTTGKVENHLRFEEKTSDVSAIRIKENEFESVAAIGYDDGDIQIHYFNNEPGVDQLDDISKEKNTIFTEHESRVTILKFNEVGNLLVSGGDDNLIVVWDLVSQRPLFKLTGHTQPITCIEILNFRGVDYVISGSRDGLLRVWDTRIQECVQIFRTNRNQVLCMEKLSESKIAADEEKFLTEYSFVIGSDSEELIFVNISDYGKDPETKLPVFIRERGRFTREYFAKVDQIAFDAANSLLILLADRKHMELLKFRSKQEVAKKFKRRQKRAKESKKELDFTKEDFVQNIKNWVEPVQRVKLSQKIDQLMLVDKTVVKKVLDFDEEQDEEEIAENGQDENLRTFDSISGALYQFASDNSYSLHQFSAQNKQFEFKLAKNFSKISHQNVIRSVAISSDDSMTLSCSVENVKLWSNENGFTRIKNFDIEGSMSSKFLPGDRYVIIGTKTGNLILIDIQTGATISTIVKAHEDTIWSIDVSENASDSNGLQIMTGSSDSYTKFWELRLVNGKISLVEVKSICMNEAVQWVKYTPNGDYYLCALMDNSIRMCYSDSDKLYLNFYGHNLPVLSMDVSSDGTLLVTGSADKYIRIWGLDFGDCHSRILVHDAPVTQVQFVKDTHYVLTASRDGQVKYIDGDTKDIVTEHRIGKSDIWALGVSSIGDFFIAGGKSKILKFFKQTKDMVFVNLETRDKNEKTVVENYLKDTHDADDATLGKRAFQSLRNGEDIIEAIVKAEELKEQFMDYEEEILQWERNGKSSIKPE